MVDDVEVGPEEIGPPPAPSVAAAAADVAPLAGPPPAPSIDPPSPDADAPASGGRPPSIAALRRERRDLFDQREQSVYHVGGLAVELRRRGMEDPGLVNRRADLVLELDQKIADLDQKLIALNGRRRQGVAPTAGYCLSCGAPFQDEAAFCFRCGARVLPPDPPEVVPQDTPTSVIDMPEEAR